MKIALITPDRAYHPFVAMIIEGLRARGDEFFASDPGNGLLPGEVLGENAWTLRAAAVDATFVFFGKEGSLAAGEPRTRAPKRHLLDPEWHRRTAYLDYSEMTATGKPMPGQVEAMLSDPTKRRGVPWIDMEMYELADYYFKRECMPDDTGYAGLIPIAFGLLADYVTPVPRYGKDWDLFCCFGHTLTGLRKEIVEEVKRLQGKHRGKKIVIRDRLGQRDYKESLARSKVVIDAWGHGDHCYRLWEALGGEACVLYQRYQVETGPDWFREGEQAVSFATMKEFTEKVEHLLGYPEEARYIGRGGSKLAREKHTGQARVEYILRTMRLI